MNFLYYKIKWFISSLIALFTFTSSSAHSPKPKIKYKNSKISPLNGDSITLADIVKPVQLPSRYKKNYDNYRHLDAEQLFLLDYVAAEWCKSRRCELQHKDIKELSNYTYFIDLITEDVENTNVIFDFIDMVFPPPYP